MRKTRKLEYHLGQVITTKKIIKEAMWEAGFPVSKNTVCLLHTGIDTQDRILRLFAVCSTLEFVGKMIYRGKDGLKKLNCSEYDYWLFETRSGTQEEIEEILNRENREKENRVTVDEIERVYGKYQILRALWVRFLSCLSEIAFLYEYAYAFDYVCKHTGIPMPEYKDYDGYRAMFPCNYSDFNYTEGIGEYFDEIIYGK